MTPILRQCPVFSSSRPHDHVGQSGLAHPGTCVQVAYLLEHGRRPLVYTATEKPQLQHLCRARQEMVEQVCRDQGLPKSRVVTVAQTREKARQVMADLLAV